MLLKEAGIVWLEGTAATTVRLRDGGGGGRRRGGRGGGLVGEVTNGAESNIDSIISSGVSIGGRLGGYIEGEDRADDGIGESIRKFDDSDMVNSADPPDVRCFAK